MSLTSNNLLYVPESLTDAGAMTATSTLDGYPVTNAQHSHIRRVYKSAVTTYRTISINQSQYSIPNQPDINCFILAGHDLTIADTMTLWAWGGIYPPTWYKLFGVQADDDGNINSCQALFFDAVTYWNWELQITTAASRSLQIGRLIAGYYVQLARGINDGFSIEELDTSVGEASDGRQGYWSNKTRYHRISIDPGQLDEGQLDRLVALYGKVGMHTPFILALDPLDNLENTYYVQFASPMTRKHVVNRQFSTGGITFEEKV